MTDKLSAEEHEELRQQLADLKHEDGKLDELQAKLDGVTDQGWMVDDGTCSQCLRGRHYRCTRNWDGHCCCNEGYQLEESDQIVAVGCTCYIREDLDWGEVLTQPSEGCPVHVRHDLSCQINEVVPPEFPWPTFSCNCAAGSER